MNHTSGKTIFVSLLAVLLTMGSCVPGKRVAGRFMESRDSISVMLVPGNSFFLYYYPINSDEVESFPVTNSRYLNNIDTTRAVNAFQSALANQLKAYKFKVFTPDQFDAFLNLEGKKFIFTVAQAEMVELDDIFQERALIDTILYRQEFLVRKLERNTWFEFSEINPADEETAQKVLFSTFFTTDQIDGDFVYRPWSGEVFYQYSSYLLTNDDVYELNRFAGQQNALYIFEYLLNREIRKANPTIESKDVYYRFNPNTQTVIPDKKAQRFILLEP